MGGRRRRLFTRSPTGSPTTAPTKRKVLLFSFRSQEKPELRQGLDRILFGALLYAKTECGLDRLPSNRRALERTNQPWQATRVITIGDPEIILRTLLTLQQSNPRKKGTHHKVINQGSKGKTAKA